MIVGRRRGQAVGQRHGNSAVGIVVLRHRGRRQGAVGGLRRRRQHPSETVIHHMFLAIAVRRHRLQQLTALIIDILHNRLAAHYTASRSIYSAVSRTALQLPAEVVCRVRTLALRQILPLHPLLHRRFGQRAVSCLVIDGVGCSRIVDAADAQSLVVVTIFRYPAFRTDDEAQQVSVIRIVDVAGGLRLLGGSSASRRRIHRRRQYLILAVVGAA